MADNDQAQNEGMATVTNAGGGTVDTGTGAYDNPPAEVTYESSVPAEPTGAVEGPPAEVTVTSPAGDEATAPTGAVDGPPAETTSVQWPATADTKAVTGDTSGVENKSVSSSMTKQELQDYATANNIAGVDQSTQTKQEMLDAINGANG